MYHQVDHKVEHAKTIRGNETEKEEEEKDVKIISRLLNINWKTFSHFIEQIISFDKDKIEKNLVDKIAVKRKFSLLI